MKRRIFIGINVSENDSRRIKRQLEKWQGLPVRWAKINNFHLTLLFLGYIDDDNLAEICQQVRGVTEKFSAFEIEFKNIELAPDLKNPRMIWLSGKASEELKNLQEEIEKALDIFTRPKKMLRPHITLGRIKRIRWNSLETKPKLNDKFKMILPVDNLEIMESVFDEGHIEYLHLETCPLSD